MKALLKTLGIVVIATVIGFSMTACGDGGGGGGGGGGGPIPLTENIWKQGVITDADGSIEYTISIPSATYCYIWWNDSGEGDGTHTGNIKVTAWDSDVTICTDKDSAWNSPESEIYLRADTIHIRVELKDNDVANAGTFAIVYTTVNSVGYTKPPIIPSSGITPLTANEWKNGEITSEIGENWYSISVTNGTMYRLWWNEISPNGDGTKTLNIRVHAWDNNVKLVLSGNDAWTNPQTFTATTGGTVYIRVSPYSASDTGTYAIGYSTSATKPGSEAFAIPGTHTPLVEAQWKDGNFTSTGGVAWYSISATSGTTYRLWWNETGASNGDGTKTGNVMVSAWYSNGTNIFQDADSAWGTARSFTPTSTTAGTVYIKVTASATGTYGIVYNIVNTRPLVIPTTVTPLIADQWEDGELSSKTSVDWYSISVTSGTTYRFWWNESDNSYGNGTKTADISVSAYYPNGTSAFSNAGNAWATPRSFTASSDGTVYIEVKPYVSSWYDTEGTYAIVYSSTESTRPAAPITVSATPLTIDQWEDGNIIENGMNWYSFSATGGDTYNLWWNEQGSSYGNGTKTGGVRVSAYYGDGTVISTINNKDSAWSTEASFNATSSGTVYIKVVFDYYPGTYGIVYSKGSTRPTASINFTPIPLTINQWKEGTLLNATDMHWYSIPVTNGTRCYFWCNDGGGGYYDGDGTKTGDVVVNGFTTEGDIIHGLSGLDASYYATDPVYFTPTYTGTVYIRVVLIKKSDSYKPGTYSIVFSNYSTRPTP